MASHLLQTQQSEPAPGVLLITLAGVILLGPESECIEALARGAIERGMRAIVFDLTEIKKIDSTGIGRFISAYHIISSANAQLRMVAGPGIVRKCFQATRLETVFRIVPSLSEALGSVKE